MDFDAKKMKELLRACRDAKVARLKLGDLEIEFTGDAEVQTKEPRPEKPAPISQEALNEEMKKADLQEQSMSAEEIEEILHLENPLLYEQMLLERELVGGNEEKLQH